MLLSSFAECTFISSTWSSLPPIAPSDSAAMVAGSSWKSLPSSSSGRPFVSGRVKIKTKKPSPEMIMKTCHGSQRHVVRKYVE